MSGENPTIVFEDRWVLGISKPSGMHSVDQAGGSGHSVARWLAAERAYMKKASPKAGDAGLLNRLDFMTSGLLLAAKDRQSWYAFNALQKAGHIRKSYLCLMEGILEAPQRVEAFIGARYRHSKKVEVREKIGKGMKRFLKSWVDLEPVSGSRELEISLVRAAIGSGRRHQIRALSSFIGHPLVGDALYGAERKLAEKLQGRLGGVSQALPEFFLHAETIELHHPFSAAPLLMTAPCPGWFYSLQSIF